MKLPASLRWIGLALLGLLIAAGVALAATRLIGRQIGIDSESITAGGTLAPAFNSSAKRHPPTSGDDGETEKNSTPSNPTEAGPEPTVEPEATEVESGDGGGESPDD